MMVQSEAQRLRPPHDRVHDNTQILSLDVVNFQVNQLTDFELFNSFMGCECQHMLHIHVKSFELVSLSCFLNFVNRIADRRYILCKS